MDKNLRWRVIAILAVVAVSIWGFYPPQKKVRLGLDLQGGVHLVLRVQTDDALRLDTETTMEQLRKPWRRRLTNLTFAGVDPTRFRIDGVPQEQDAAFREAAAEVETRFNRESGTAGSYSFVMKPNLAVQLREDAVEQALQTIERRVNELGVAEPVVARTGAAGDQILVQLPGVANPQRAKDIIRSTALLELKLVEDGRPARRNSCYGRAAASCRATWKPCLASATRPPRATAPKRSTTWSGKSPWSPDAICATPSRRSTR
jgi:preprotein translocase subunit SecD